MARITLYLDDTTEREVREAAASRGVSVSRFVARLIERRLASQWPDDVASMAGAWPDLPDAEEIRRGQGEDVRRGAL